MQSEGKSWGFVSFGSSQLTFSLAIYLPLRSVAGWTSDVIAVTDFCSAPAFLSSSFSRRQVIHVRHHVTIRQMS